MVFTDVAGVVTGTDDTRVVVLARVVVAAAEERVVLAGAAVALPATHW